MDEEAAKCDVKEPTESIYENDKEKGPWLQARYLVVFAAFLANAVFYIMRVNLSVAIVAMTISDDALSKAAAREAPQFDWDASTRGIILSSFFWGYIWTQIPSGYLAQRYGPKLLFLVTMLLSSLATFLFVPASNLGWEYACASRVFLGLAQGALLPCCHALLTKWALPSERGRMSVYTYTGQQLGTVAAMSSSGVISAAAGWPVVFYVSGLLGLVASVAWWYLVADTPSQHRLCSARERRMLETSINEAAGSSRSDDTKPLNTPWGAIMTSVPMWSLIVVHSANNWGFWTLLTEIPSYMNGVLNFELAQNGFLSSLPYLAMWMTGLVLSWASDYLLKRKCYSVAVSRKIGNSIAHYGSAISLIVLGFVSADETAAVAILTLAVACSSGAMIGYQVNHIDLSPNFASTMVGITNCVSNIFSIVAPLVAGYIVTDLSNADQWRLVFLIAAGFYIVGNTTFVVFGSGDVQPWNNPEWTKHKSKQEPPRNETINKNESPKLHRY